MVLSALRFYATIELELLIVLTQYNLAAKEFGRQERATPEQKRRIGRNSLFLQMIDPGARGETAENLDPAASERSGG